jgi:hypothetical protein
MIFPVEGPVPLSLERSVWNSWTRAPTAEHSASIRAWNATISWSVRFCDVLRACEHSNAFDRQCYDSVP